ncbi:hypothetical protein SmJEL517_g02951 [Synchytrium microbalum]|uniref:Ribosome biogenesis protein NOP53 n=1 Tax=Synchytrium microbalum TaxID=1806994 RepID=A0A507C400_9FUNG|nr:uncharacterized protein SmJEL517_g02951 [Synchytrium microbalum]TPX34392.1 hypothetical protein SmJEL517_g02951 [Synchytrium microbalum]
MGKQPSRKTKTAWRKNVDLSKIETSLAEIEVERRQHGKPLHQQPDESLFVIDKKPDPKYKIADRRGVLRLDQILAQRSKIPSFSTRPKQEKSAFRVKVNRNLKGEAALIQKLVEKAKIKSEIKRKGVKAIQTKTANLSAKDVQLGKRGREPWDDGMAEQPEYAHLNEYVKATLPVAVKKPKTVASAPVDLPAVAIPPPGTSYNPTYESHQELLQLAVDKEESRLAKIEQVKRKLWYPPELDLLDDETFFDDQDNADDEDDDAAQEGVNGVVATGIIKRPATAEFRKTRKQRLEMAKRVKEEYELEKKRTEKRMNKELNRLGEIKKTLEQNKSTAEGSETPQPAIQQKHKQKRLGPHKQKDEPIDVVLTDELPDTLLQLKPEGNTFQDLFLGIQKRELVEPRKPVSKKRKFKVKTYESHDYKRFV